MNSPQCAAFDGNVFPALHVSEDVTIAQLHAAPSDIIVAIRGPLRRADVSSLFSVPSITVISPALVLIAVERDILCFFGMSAPKKSGFKPCRECGGRMSVSDLYNDCLWCLSSDHDVLECGSCQKMNPKALKESEAKLFLAKAKKEKRSHHRSSSGKSAKSHRKRRHHDSRHRSRASR
ncbi:hypothetical protein NDU88_000276 [Pleurodeles waltl]|uniref:Uncharacterized protein n=1 Tax=Pleurodeles waltl TaxID=8319 RepID=A0AAV7L7V2_PLEWA|nr:hypothetical protein NDU88_000276 [Pleurodeles waltl]